MKTIYYQNTVFNTELMGIGDLQALTKAALLKGIAHFAYIKKSDGTKREAFGTLNGDLIPAEAIGGGGNANEGVQRYYDIEARAWRTYTIENLIAVL